MGELIRWAESLPAEPEEEPAPLDIDYYLNEGIAPLDQVDAVVVNGVGILSNYPVPEVYPWGSGPAAEAGWFYEEWGGNTLAGFLFRLSLLISPRTEIAAPILSRYLANLRVKRVQQFASVGQTEPS